MNNNKARVIIIEDNIEYASMLKTVLSKSEGLKYELISFTNLKDSLSELKNNDVDVVLLDLDLPDSSGLDTFNKVSSTTSSLPLLSLQEMMMSN
ncbi:MAG: response regulator [Candidatus Dadabacteria bacterium]|nr:response regulator [Candidatus Dadabacteria bacterium]